MYYIYNDGCFATDYVGYSKDCPCLICDNIPSKTKANLLLKEIRKRFSEFNENEFYIVEDEDIVRERLEEGETLKDIFTKSINLMYY